MSSSHPNATLKTSESTISEVLPCPECGKKAMRRFKGECKLLDGTVVPELERWHCFSCNDDFFDPAAMEQIEDYRKEMESQINRSRKKVTESNNA